MSMCPKMDLFSNNTPEGSPHPHLRLCAAVCGKQGESPGFDRYMESRTLAIARQ